MVTQRAEKLIFHLKKEGKTQAWQHLCGEDPSQVIPAGSSPSCWRQEMLECTCPCSPGPFPSPSQPFQAPLHIPKSPQAVLGHSQTGRKHFGVTSANISPWGHLWKHQPLGSPLVPHGLGSPGFGLWDCPCGFEGLGKGAAWLGSWRRTPRDLHFIAGSFCREGRKNPGAPGTELETPSSVPYIPQNPTISTLLLFKKVNKIPSFKERKKKKRKGKYAANSPVCVF